MATQHQTSPAGPVSVASASPAPTFTSSLSEKHRDDLLASGIPEPVAKALDLYSATAAEVATLLGRRAPVGAGLVIPYKDLDGRPLLVRGEPYVRVRLDDPPLAATPGHPQGAKYLARRGSGQFPYITPAVAHLLRSGSVQTLVVVEGEKKAIKAEVEGLAAVGIPGNFGFKEKGSAALHPMLEAAIPAGIAVILVWDSDAAANPAFAAATRLFHPALRHKGCTLKVVVLPQAGAGKVGLDDYLVAHGVADFHALVAAAAPLGDRQPRVDQLIEAWLPALRPAVQSLPEPEGRALLTKTFNKGWLDNVEDPLRVSVIDRLAGWASWDVRGLFYGMALARAGETCSSSPAPPQSHAQPPPAPPADPVKPGTEVSLHEDDERRFRVERVDRELLWATPSGYSRRGPSFPVVARSARVLSTTVARQSAADLADAFLAERMSHEGELALRHYRGAFYRWRDGNFVERDHDAVAAEVMGFLRQHSRARATGDTVNNVVANLKSTDLCHVPAHLQPPAWVGLGKVTPAPGLLPLANGVLDLSALAKGADDDDVLLEPTPRLFALNGLPVAFDPLAQCPRWTAFLTRVLPDGAMRQLVQEFIGYLLQPDTSLQRMLLLVGNGANGKGVLLDVVTALLGRHNVSSVPLAKFAERFSLAPLATCLLNAVSELPVSEAGTPGRVAEDKLKAIVSGDLVEVERKNRDPISVRPTARLIFAANELPVLADRSSGIWRRQLVVPFDVSIPEGEQDPDLAASIARAELPGVLNWAVEGRLRLYARGRFEEPAASAQVKAAHRMTCAHEEEFLAEHCRAGGDGDFVPTAGLYAAYQAFCAASGYRAMGKNRFVQALRRRFPASREDRRPVDRAAWPAIEERKPRGWTHVRFCRDGTDDEEENSHE